MDSTRLRLGVDTINPLYISSVDMPFADKACLRNAPGCSHACIGIKIATFYCDTSIGTANSNPPTGTP
ncbi:hypothetical protein SLA2020_506170 [Shorea laevis]